jgi:N-acetylmuramoyl-L-alanine amidase
MFNIQLLSTFFLILTIFTPCHAKKHRTATTQKPTYTIMINPVGDAQNTGRLIDGSFERTLTFECAQHLKNLVEQQYPHIAVVLTRTPGQTVAPLHNANFANRLPADFFIDLRFYQETQAKPSLFIYYFSYQPDCTQKPSEFAFYTHDQSYIFNYKASQQWAHKVYATCAQPAYAQQYISHKPIAAPCAPLIGITAPALIIEVGLKQKTDWQLLTNLLVDTIKLVTTP